MNEVTVYQYEILPTEGIDGFTDGDFTVVVVMKFGVVM